MVEALGHDSYLVWMDRSGHISKRNRRFLRIIRLFKDILLDLGKGQMGQHRSESPKAVSDSMKPVPKQRSGVVQSAAGVLHPSGAVSGPLLGPAQRATTREEAGSNTAAAGPESNTGNNKEKQRRHKNDAVEESNILKEGQVRSRRKPNFYGRA